MHRRPLFINLGKGKFRRTSRGRRITTDKVTKTLEKVNREKDRKKSLSFERNGRVLFLLTSKLEIPQISRQVDAPVSVYQKSISKRLPQNYFPFIVEAIGHVLTAEYKQYRLKVCLFREHIITNAYTANRSWVCVILLCHSTEREQTKGNCNITKECAHFSLQPRTLATSYCFL